MHVVGMFSMPYVGNLLYIPDSGASPRQGYIFLIIQITGCFHVDESFGYMNLTATFIYFPYLYSTDLLQSPLHGTIHISHCPPKERSV